MKRCPRILIPIVPALLLHVAFAAGLLHAGGLESITISAPGPHNISYLPIDLIVRIGADREEGCAVRLLPTGGGAVALSNLVQKNVDFAVAGVPAAMSLKSHGGDVVVILPINDAPLFVLMVRAELRDEIKGIADLKGRVLGVNTSTRSSKTTSQQLVELLLRSAGVPVDTVRIVPAGQSWEEQSSLILSASVDAVMGDEPFASRLLEMGKVYFLAHLALPESVRGIPGSRFLHAALETRSDVIAEQPEKVAKVVRMIRKSLAWIASHSATELVEKLAITDVDERRSLILALERYPAAFSPDGRFSTAQLRETALFFQSGNDRDLPNPVFELDSLIDDRWAGRGP
ncbi:MAG: ABC transporter substrate-binding protein [Magnetococcales bacterium]|nr:ABC transporter substrate-binding protein [Magnetococcales bacterium]